MLLSLLPTWGVIIALIIAFVGKHFLVATVEKSSYYLNRITGQGWVGAVNTVAGLNAAATAAILLIPAGWHWAVFLAVADGIVFWLVGYWKVKKRLPTVDAKNLSTLYQWATLVHGTTYVSIIAFVVKFLAPEHAA